MQTKLKEHLNWGLFLVPIITVLCFNFQDITNFFLPYLMFIMTFVAGSCYPDLDLCLSPTSFPRIKQIVLMLKLLTIFVVLFDHWPNMQLYTSVNLLIALLWLNSYLIINLMQRVGLFLLLGCKVDGSHRESAFHSLFVWFAIIKLPVTNLLLMAALKGLGWGAVAHIFLDHFGSFIGAKDLFTFKILLKTCFLIVVFINIDFLLLYLPSPCSIVLSDLSHYINQGLLSLYLVYQEINQIV
jgi:hypothetical protein